MLAFTSWINTHEFHVFCNRGLYMKCYTLACIYQEIQWYNRHRNYHVERHTINMYDMNAKDAFALYMGYWRN